MRKPARTVDSTEVQGEGTYVVIRRLLWGEYEALQALADAKEIDDAEHGRRMMALRIAQWNWTDEDGTALPTPRDDSSVLARLTDEEMAFLVRETSSRDREEREATKSGGEPATVGALREQGVGAA